MAMATSPSVNTATRAGPTTLVIESADSGRRVSPLAVTSWALYDFANTIFSLNIISTFFPQFVKELGKDDAVYAFPMSASLLVVALISPLLGVLSDRAGGKRIPWLVATTLLCVAMTALMGIVPELWMVIGALLVANIGYQTALIFYDALLPSVSTTLNWGKISGLGVGLGYAGALLGGIAVTLMIGTPRTRIDFTNKDAFIPTTLLFLLFALPCFLFVRERRPNVERAVPAERVT